MKNKYNIQELLETKSFYNWVYKLNKKDVLDWELWLREHPEQKPEIQEAEAIIRGIPFKKHRIPEHEINQKWDELDALLDVEENPNQDNLYRKSNLLKLAAVFLVMLVAGGLIFNLLDEEKTYTTFHTDYGQTLEFHLPDSTKVFLNANSSIKMAEDWAKSPHREVWLEGEAYFDVQKDILKNKPFIVHSDPLSVKVLGTKFNVNTFRDDLIVVLEEGLVQVEKDQHVSLPLAPGEMLSFSYKNKTFKKTEVNTSTYTSWRNNLLVLESTSLLSLSEFLEDYYGISTVIENEALAKKQLTGEIPISSLDDMLKAISLSLEVNVTKRQDRIFISTQKQ